MSSGVLPVHVRSILCTFHTSAWSWPTPSVLRLFAASSFIIRRRYPPPDIFVASPVVPTTPPGVGVMALTMPGRRPYLPDQPAFGPSTCFFFGAVLGVAPTACPTPPRMAKRAYRRANLPPPLAVVCGLVFSRPGWASPWIAEISWKFPRRRRSFLAVVSVPVAFARLSGHVNVNVNATRVGLGHRSAPRTSCWQSREIATRGRGMIREGDVTARQATTNRSTPFSTLCVRDSLGLFSLLSSWVGHDMI